ncbi:MAG: glycosyltransferase family 9 protein, partial [Bdellovibrionales bacterium]|nr:glycosyltransferase family 9 protein [Bdellovibrionales bacterium]
MKKIVVRAPNWLGDITMSLPFFLALPKAFPDCEYHVIVKPEYEAYFSILPYKIKTHVFSRTRNKGLSGWKRFKNENPDVLNADFFFVLPPSFSSALMSRYLKAKERVGFDYEMRGLWLTQKYKFPKGMHRADDFLLLLNSAARTHYERRLHEVSVPGYFEENKGYVVINVNSEASSRRMPLDQWKIVIEKLKGETLVFVGTEKERAWVSEV